MSRAAEAYALGLSGAVLSLLALRLGQCLAGPCHKLVTNKLTYRIVLRRRSFLGPLTASTALALGR